MTATLDLIRNFLQAFLDNNNKLPVDTELTGFSVAKIIDAGDMSGSITSTVLDVLGVTCVSFQLSSAASGTRAGTIAIQGSNDNSNWVALVVDNRSTGAVATSIAVTASTLLSELVEVSDCGFRYLRVVYTSTSGTGTLTVTTVAK